MQGTGTDTGTFTMLRDGGAPDLDPHSQYDNAAAAIVLATHEMLIKFKGESTFDYEPMLAEIGTSKTISSHSICATA